MNAGELPPKQDDALFARRGKFGKRGFLFCFVLCILALFAGLLNAGRWWYAPGPYKAETVLVIPPGTGVRAIAKRLSNAGVVRYEGLYAIAVRVLGGKEPLKAGEYRFDPSMSPAEITALLQEGANMIRKFTCAEGITVKQCLDVVAQAPALEGEVPTNLPEGSLLPETYHYTYGEQRAAVVARMKQAMDEVVAKLWAGRKQGLPINTPEEAVILASVVEKETGVPEERGRVAAVFVNRMRIGMPLQSDPTVIYGITLGQKDLGRLLTRKDLETPSEYNTYTINRLPRGPIALPGKEALAAVMDPPQTEELYFVADGNGGHRFAASLEVHNRNVVLFRKSMQQ